MYSFDYLVPYPNVLGFFFTNLSVSVFSGVKAAV